VAVPNNKDVLDVDFERVATTTDRKDESLAEKEEEGSPFSETPRSLLDVSLDSGDPQWKEARIPFCRGDEYIDGKLAFMVDLEGVGYGIAVPFDDPVAIVEENPKKNDEIHYVDPEKYDDDEENQELMEIMAAQVKEQLGEELTLRKTPKVLTISGGLGKITDDWERSLMPKSVSVQDLMENDGDSIDEEIASFYDFMKEELGEKEFEKTMNEDMSEEDMELLNLFDISGLGTQKDDLAGLEELVKGIEDDVDEVKQAKEFEPNTDGVSLKLIGFNFADGTKSYCLVKLLQPYVLIGKYVGDEKEGIRFELLTREEERVLIPKLEELCQEDLQAAGLSLSTSKETSS
jgi:hypothetical protein